MGTIKSTFIIEDKATSVLQNIAEQFMITHSILSKTIDINYKITKPNFDFNIPKVDTPNVATQQPISPDYTSQINNLSEVQSKLTSINSTVNTIRDTIARQNDNLAQQNNILTGQQSKISTITTTRNETISSEQIMFAMLGKIGLLLQEQVRLTNDIAGNTNNVVNKLDNVGSGYSKVNAGAMKHKTSILDTIKNMARLNQAIELVKRTLDTVGKAMSFTDDTITATARLNLINDGLQTTQQLQDKIFASAMRSRGQYDLMLKSISKMGILAKHAFKSNDEMIAFNELLAKTYKVSGASAEEMRASTYQLIQAMAAGKLQGDEFKSIEEGAPMLATKIAEYLNVPQGMLKKLAKEGKITSDVIKNAMFQASADIEAKFIQLPLTWSDYMMQLENITRKHLEPVSNMFKTMLNSNSFKNTFMALEIGIYLVSKALQRLLKFLGDIYNFVSNELGTLFSSELFSNVWNGFITATILTYEVLKLLFNGLLIVYNFIKDNFDTIVQVAGMTLVMLAVTYIPVVLTSIGQLIVKLLMLAGAWLAQHFVLVGTIAIFGILSFILYELGFNIQQVALIVLGLIAVLSMWHIIQWLVNGAILACPIMWIILGIIALIGVIFILVDSFAQATGVAESGFGVIMGGLAVVGQAFMELFKLVQKVFNGIIKFGVAVGNNIGKAFTNPIGYIENAFYSMLATITNVVKGIIDVINMIPRCTY